MPRTIIHTSNFNGGLLSPGFIGRSDLRTFQNGLQEFTNWATLVPGGIRRRPGTLFKYDFGDVPTRIVSFNFNETQRYIIAFQNERFLVINPTDATLLTTVDGCPWTDSDLFTLRYTQRADVMVVTHNDFEPRLIRRTGFSTFTVQTFPWEEDISGWPKFRPQYKVADPGVTLLPSGSTGSITLTTSSDHWTTDHVGTVVEYRGKQVEITAYTDAQNVTGTVREELNDAYRVTVTNSEDFQIGETLFGKDTSGRAEIVSKSATYVDVNQLSGDFIDGEEVEGLTTGTVGFVSGVPVGISPLASEDWTEQAFSSAAGYPRACIFHGGRLWFGGSTSLPANIFGSNAQAFFKFDVGDAFPADSIVDLIAADDVHQIEHLHSGQQLQIFTDQGVFYAPESENRPLTPEDFLLKRISWYGARQARPAQHEQTTLMAQEDSPLIREVIWNELQQNFAHDVINYQAHTLSLNTKQIVVADSVSGEREPYAMLLQEDGTIAVWTGIRRENISAWAKWETRAGDTFESVANIDGKIYAVAYRNLNGIRKRILELFDFDTAADCVILSPVIAAGQQFTGFDIFDSVDVEVVAPVTGNQWYVGTLVPNSGTIDTSTVTPQTFTQISAGLNYTATATPMPVATELPNGELRGRKHRIVSTLVSLNESMDFSLSGNVMRVRSANDDPSLPPALFTGERRFHMFGWGQRENISIVSDVPLPAEVLSLTYEVAF